MLLSPPSRGLTLRSHFCWVFMSFAVTSHRSEQIEKNGGCLQLCQLLAPWSKTATNMPLFGAHPFPYQAMPGARPHFRVSPVSKGVPLPFYQPSEEDGGKFGFKHVPT